MTRNHLKVHPPKEEVASRIKEIKLEIKIRSRLNSAYPGQPKSKTISLKINLMPIENLSKTHG